MLHPTLTVYPTFTFPGPALKERQGAEMPQEQSHVAVCRLGMLSQPDADCTPHHSSCS